MTRAKRVKKLSIKQSEIPIQGIQATNIAEPIFKASDQQLAGHYCNVAMISHTNLEFVFDYFLSMQNLNVLVSRVITSPQHAKRIYEVLGENIKKFEEKNGIIRREV